MSASEIVASAAILTLDHQVKHMADTERIRELLRGIYVILDGEGLCDRLGRVLLHALSLAG